MNPKNALIQFTDRGLYITQADVYIDPWRKVKRALITHGHADHARWGMEHYLCTHAAKPVIKFRLGNKIDIDSVEFGETKTINGVKFSFHSFHPAGHIIGSAQIRVEYKGEVWVVSGDYKTENDGLSENFESVKCHTFITESTFGLPVYKWKPQAEVFEEINAWWAQNRKEGKTTVLTGYSLGKAQRLLHGLDTSIGKIFTHGAVENTNQILRKQGVKLPDTVKVSQHVSKKDYAGNIVVCPPSATGNPWVKKLGDISVGSASGWMMIRGARRRRNVDRGFVLSDHADWTGLLSAIESCEAESVFVTHGYSKIFSKYLREKGYQSAEVKTEYDGDEVEINADSENKKDETK